MKNHARLVVLFSLCLAIRVSAVGSAFPSRAAPGTIHPDIRVVAADWSSQLPPTGSVNAPGRIEGLCPEQTFSLAIVADGEIRDNPWDTRRLDLRIESAGGTREFHGLKPSAIRAIKAEGADRVASVLAAGGIGGKDQAALTRAMALVTFALFQVDWSAPDVHEPAVVQIQATISGGAETAPTLRPLQLTIRPWTDWAKEPAASPAALGGYLNQFRDNAQPGLLLSLLAGTVDQNGLSSPAAAEYFALSFANNPAARKAALGMLPTLEPKLQEALLRVCRLGGVDLTDSLRGLSPAAQASVVSAQPFTDASRLPTFQDPVPLDSVRGIGGSMDQCWGAWMATGDPRYLRALVELLGAADDFNELAAWQKAKTGAKGLNAKVARGLAYQIAGWSLASFERTDPHVADWLIYWQNDPTVELELRKQIAALPTNPAFRRK